jgi:hypothetical protein
MTTTTLIYSSYNDISKFESFIHLIPKHIQIIIYEKKNEITDIDAKPVLTSPFLQKNILHYHIPFVGEQHYALIMHIINNYDSLQGIIHFSKTHWTSVFQNINHFLQELNATDVVYRQHNAFRKFYCIFPDVQSVGHKHAIYDLLHKNNIPIDMNYINSFDKNCNECNNNLKCYSCGMYVVDNYYTYNCYFTVSYLTENHNCMKKLREIFDNYNPITEYKACNMDTSYIINSKVILYHSIDVYKNILSCLKNGFFCGHDEIANFIHLFFQETANRISM